jgi:hypothetical protein
VVAAVFENVGDTIQKLSVGAPVGALLGAR